VTSCAVATSKLAASGGADGAVRLWSLTKPKSRWEQTMSFDRAHRGSVECVCAGGGQSGAHGAYASRLVFSSGVDAQVCAWDPAASTPVCALRGHRGAVRVVRADATRLFSGSDDGSVRRWDLRTNRAVLVLDCSADGSAATGDRGSASRITAMELGTPADPIVVTGSSDGVLRVWDCRNADCPQLELPGHTNSVTCLQWDFTKVLTGSLDTTLRLWNLQSGKCVQVLVGHSGPISALHFDESTVRLFHFFCLVNSFVYSQSFLLLFLLSLRIRSSLRRGIAASASGAPTKSRRRIRRRRVLSRTVRTNIS
jgi:WD40 repeat protein